MAQTAQARAPRQNNIISIPDGYTYRTIDVGEIRADAPSNAPEGSLGERLTGYAAKFNTRSELIYGQFYEEIAPGAFKDSLQDGADVRFTLNHDKNFVLGRNKSGTLDLREDNTGLKFEVWPPESQWARDLLTSVKRGDINQCSFLFRTIEDDWREDTKSGLLVRTLVKVALRDVSLVTYPAYEDTLAEVRSEYESALERFKAERIQPSEARARELDLLEAEISLDEPMGE